MPAKLLARPAPRHRPMLRSARPPQPSRTAAVLEQMLAALLCVPIVPLVAVLWAIVRLTSPGPGIYRQRRLGRAGREFWIYKLRTMRHGCERGTGAVWSTPGDSRVTPIGRLLRKTHLDELPQIFNVLLGDMSLVGPRPERPEIVASLERQIDDYNLRLAILPGVTGLAQIFAEPDQTLDDVRRKLRYDLLYLRNRSFSLDLRIVLCTALKIVGLNRPELRAWLFGGIEARD